MRHLRLTSVALVAFAGAAHAKDPSEIVVAGPLSAAEGLTLAGRVEGGSEPVQVELWRYEFEDTGQWYHRTERVAAVVPPGGRWRFTGLAPGRYACDFGDQKSTFAGPAPDVDLVRDVADRVLTVPSNCRLKGRVTPAFPERKSHHVRVSLGYFDVDAAPDGTYETPDVPPGDYRATVRESWLADPGPYRFDSIARSVPVHLDGGVKTLDVTLTPDVLLHVSVRSANAGEGFEGRYSARSDVVDWERGWFRVVAGDAPSMQKTRPTYPHGAEEWDEPAPALVLDHVPAGRHRISLTALGFAPWAQDVDVGPRARVEAVMVPTPGQFVATPKLPDVARVEIRPVRGVWRELFACDRRMQSMAYPYEPPVCAFLEPGRYEWRAESLDGVPTRAEEIVVTEDRGTVTLVPAFSPGRALRGHLRAKSGRPLGGVRLRFSVLEGDAWRLVPTKDTPTEAKTGEFETKGLSPGRWRAQLDDAGAAVLGEFDVADADARRDFVFAPR